MQRYLYGEKCELALSTTKAKAQEVTQMETDKDYLLRNWGQGDNRREQSHYILGTLVGYYYDGSTVSLWVDGSEVDSASVSAIGNNDEPLCIGIREVRAKPTGWDGRIDQVRFYNRKCVQVLTT